MNPETNQLNSLLLHELKNISALINGNAQVIECGIPNLTGLRQWRQLKEDILILRSFLDEMGGVFYMGEEKALRNNVKQAGRPMVSGSPVPIEEKGVHSLRTLIENVAGSFQSFYAGYGDMRGATMKLLLDDGADISHFNYRGMKQVLINLIKNAIEACNKDNCWIFLHLYKSVPGYVTLEIIDNGKGISPDKLEQIFEIGFTTKPAGTGFGLPIVKSIIEQQGGSVSCSVGDGLTTFTLMLPSDS